MATSSGSAVLCARGLRIEALTLLGLLSAFVLSAVACRSLRSVHVRPVSSEASRAFAEARAAIDGRGEFAGNDGGAGRAEARASTRARARALARAALEAEPGWVGPARLLDDLDREDLRGVQALTKRREALATEGESAGALYLAGRLEGAEGESRFERAVDLDPDHAWARHGMAWSAQRRGQRAAAVAHERAALARARDPWERSYFTASLARFLAQAGRREEALAEARRCLGDPELLPADRLGLELESLALAMDRLGSDENREATRRALDLLREEHLSESEIETLVARLQIATLLDKSRRLEISTALAAQRSPARDRLRAELMLSAGATPLALGLLERSGEEEGRVRRSGRLIRVARFAAGEPIEAVERWLADLPTVLRDADGIPRDERLARVVRDARALRARAPSGDEGEAWFALGDSLLAAGWFAEARALAGDLARTDFERALVLETRATSGVQLLEALDEAIVAADTDAKTRPATASLDPDAVATDDPRRSTAAREGARDLTGLLAALGPLFARAQPVLGPDIDAGALGKSLERSPRLEYGPVGDVVHPGPWFSAADERAGLGAAESPVLGLASAMAAIGRFALIGQLAGAGGPDGTILSRLLVERRSGEHLGVPWSGTIAWCEGADVRSRIERAGARISAAALHEGYWLDVQAVRGELGVYRSLAREFGGKDGARRAVEALASAGLPLESTHPDHRRSERRRLFAVLGEASRVRIAVLLDRSTADEPGMAGRVSLDELVQVTATHEEGHLTDRTRFLPLSQHWTKALALLLDCGFSPTRVAERLEYRAQLVALCDVPDPRIPLALTLDAAESEGQGPTAHAAGYARLLGDLVGVFDERLAARAEDFPEIDPQRTLVHQLHRLPAEVVRTLARELARKQGMVR